MTRQFQFEPRDECACGELLEASCPRIDKPSPWGSVTFLQCSHCATWCQSPAVTAASLAEWFDSEDYQGSKSKVGAAYADYLGHEASRLAEARDRYDRDLAPLLKPAARVLEVGCATGSLLSVIRAHGHEVHGADMSKTFAEYGRATYGLDIQLGDVLDLKLPSGHFDAVIALGTVGNLRSTAGYFARFRELIGPGGFLIFNFPDASSVWVRYVYRQRFWMFTPSGLTFLTRRGCQAALAKAGFDIVRVKQDYQRPSMGKLIRHAQADAFALPLLAALGWKDSSVPCPIPVPTVRLVVARPSIDRARSSS